MFLKNIFEENPNGTRDPIPPTPPHLNAKSLEKFPLFFITSLRFRKEEQRLSAVNEKVFLSRMPLPTLIPRSKKYEKSESRISQRTKRTFSVNIVIFGGRRV